MAVKKKPARASEPTLSGPLRRYLYFTAALTGAAIMIVEILGAKMLAPYVGTSHFVWTAQIAVTLVALAAGYYVGGRLVDRSPKLGPLYTSVVVAALYLCLTVMMAEPVSNWCLRFNLAMGALLASALLFFIPLGLLAMVGPFFVRVLTLSLGTVGGNVGRLTAISTLGSFVGTVLIGYVLIPFLPNSLTMFATAIVLIGLSLTYFMVWARGRATMPCLLGLVSLGLGYGGVYQDLHPSFERVEELALKNSAFGVLQVLQEKEGAQRWYLNDYLIQNTYDILAKQSRSMFTYMLHELPRTYTPQIDKVLCIGLGVGIVPMEFLRDGAEVDVVEINPAVVPIAKEYFDCQPERLNLTIGDGRYFVNQTGKQYDVIVLDAFLGDSSPSHLMTREAFASIARVLKLDGVLVMNCFGNFESGQDFLVASLHKTLADVFPGVRIHNAYNGGNVLFVASMQAELKMHKALALGAVHPAAQSAVRIAFSREVDTNPESGMVLTDAHNPVEYYDAANRERFRRGLVAAVKDF